MINLNETKNYNYTITKDKMPIATINFNLSENGNIYFNYTIQNDEVYKTNKDFCNQELVDFITTVSNKISKDVGFSFNVTKEE